ncbi:MAG: hypothetical protein U1A25_00535, partial [Candidatus Sungbacteria bacterium]|nr:hypothetical protein [Candidatus Sungbacteria bacterium]
MKRIFLFLFLFIIISVLVSPPAVAQTFTQPELQQLASMSSLLSSLSAKLQSLFDTSISSAQAQVTSGLIAHWKLDEASGITATDASGNGNTGMLVNNPAWTTGKIGGALN